MSNDDKFVCCEREFKNRHAMMVHKARMHPKKAKQVKTQAKKEKMVIPIKINFCPSCGNHIPNAFVMQGGGR